jgi:hypothetical protein
MLKLGLDMWNRRAIFPRGFVTRVRSSRVQEPSRATIALFAFTIVLVYLLSSSWRFPLGGDGRATLAGSRSLLTHHTLAIDLQFASDEGYGPRAKIGVDGRAYGKAGLGLPIVELPFVAVALAISRFAAVPEAQAVAAILSLLNPLLTACTVILVFRVCRSLECPVLAALSVAVAYAFGTLAWVYAGVDGPEPLQALCLVLALLFLLEYRADRRASWLSASGSALAFAVVAKPANAVLVPAFGLYVMTVLRTERLSLRRAAPALAHFVSPLAICALFLLWLNWIRFGSVLDTGYEHDAFTNPFLSGIYGLVFSFNKGVIFYSPLVLLVPVGIGLMARAHREEAALIVLASLSYVSLFATYAFWGAGWAWGPRYLVPLLPLLMPPVARAVAAARVWRYLGAVLFAAGFAVNGLGVLVDGDAHHSAIMNVDLTAQTGFVQIGSVQHPGQMVDMPVPPDYVLPQFSEIAGKLWLAGVALDGCSCDEQTAECGCLRGTMEKDARFSSPPWAKRYPDVHPLPPYGSRLINPWIVNRMHQAFASRSR